MYQRDYLNTRIEELKRSIAIMDEESPLRFVAEKLVDLYQFELKKYTKR